MKKIIPTTKVFKDRINAVLENTLNFENCSSFVRYDYEDRSKSIGSALNLCLASNYVMDTVVPYLKANSNIKVYEQSAAEKYYGRPMAFSQAEYGSTDYWWVILAVNGYFNPNDFRGWTQLIVPTTNDIEQIFDRESYVNDELGEIPANLNSAS